jgi:hypothetical protein
MMVRNIDLPEALILYGKDVICDPSVANTAREGLSGLLEECHQVQTAVIILLEDGERKSDDATSFVENLFGNPVATPCHVISQTEAPPNPTDLLNALESVIIQPRAFGGSSGFGSKPPDPERHPEPKHCVVISSTIHQTRAARAVGMRVVSVDPHDDLADAVLFQDEIDFWLDDIATPGSSLFIVIIFRSFLSAHALYLHTFVVSPFCRFLSLLSLCLPRLILVESTASARRQREQSRPARPSNGDERGKPTRYECWQLISCRERHG